ncbi:hypothetical protein H7170_00535 [Candidatus Gracilibacteria bacterium]|nr:hypothetical protein [Candidatus Gracilibacteria bacterium]
MINSFFTGGLSLTKVNRFYNAGRLVQNPEHEEKQKSIEDETKKLTAEVEGSIKNGDITSDTLHSNDEIKMKVVQTYSSLSNEGKLLVNNLLIEGVQNIAPNYKNGSQSMGEYADMDNYYKVANMKPEELFVKMEKYGETKGLIKFGREGTQDKPNPLLLNLPVDVDAFRQEQTQKMIDTANKYKNMNESKPEAIVMPL